MASSTQSFVPPQSSLTGSTINLTTGVFQQLQPRGRVAKACENCRIRKGKCNGEDPCERCFARGLRCEYASLKKHGPNKNRRKAAVPPAAASPDSERRIPSSVPPPASLNSSGNVSDYHRSQTSPRTPDSYAVEISSSQSSPAPARRAAPETSRPRSATLGRNPSRSFCNMLDAFPYARAGVSKRCPLPRPIRPTEARTELPSFLAEHAPKPEFPIRIETSISNRNHTLAKSYSRTALHNSDTAGGSSAFPDRRDVSQDIDRFLHQLSVSAILSSSPSANWHTVPSTPGGPPLSRRFLPGIMQEEATETARPRPTTVSTPASSDKGHLSGFDGMAEALQARGYD